MNETYSAGRALSLGFKVFFRNLIPFAIIGCLLSLPYFIWVYFKLADLELGFFGFADDTFPYKMLAFGVLTQLVMTSALTYGVVMELNGSHASLGSCIAVGLKRFFPVLGVGLVMGLIFFVILFIAGMAIFPLGIVAVIGALLFIGMIYALYYVALPSAVIERPGVAGALLRSRDLTAGHRGGIFGVIVLLAVAKYFINKWVGEGMVDEQAIMEGGEEVIIALVKKIIWVDVAITTVFSILTGVIAAVTYYLLRSEKEGTSSQDLASVFE